MWCTARVSGPPGDRDPQPLVLERVAKPARGWRAGLGRLVTIGVAGSLFVVVAAAVIFRPSEPPQTATLDSPSPTTSPSRSPRPTPSPTATPLPQVVTPAGSDLRDSRLVITDGYRILDLASGELRAIGESTWRDVVMARPNGGWLCACGARLGTNSADPSVGLDLVKVNDSGQSQVTTRLTEFTGVPPPQSDVLEVVVWSATTSADGRWLYLLTAVRQPPSWRVNFLAVDVAAGEIVQSLPLATIGVDLPDAGSVATPRPDSGAGVYVWPSQPLRSPDGRTLVLGLTEARQWEERYESLRHGWTIPLRGDGLADPPVIQPVTLIPQDSWCIEQPAFIDAGRIVDLCVMQSPQRFVLRTVDTAGVELATAPIEGVTSDIGQWSPIVDSNDGVAFFWDPMGHEAARIDLHNPAEVRLAAVPKDELEAIRARAGSNDRGSWLDPPTALSPDRLRLYAVGLVDSGRGSSGSTGVWVFDAGSLELIDHWEATATITSIDVSDDGRLVYVTGAPGMDAEGRASSWPASLTVYDAATGDVVRVYNDFGQENQVNFARRPPG